MNATSPRGRKNYSARSKDITLGNSKRIKRGDKKKRKRRRKEEEDPDFKMATQIATQSSAPAAYEPPAYPAGQHPTPPHQGPIDSQDLEHWNQHINTAIANPSQQLHEASPPDAQKWHASYCGFCSPFEQGLITCCCPCFTFGKTHHRLRWGNHMENYESTNTSVS